MRAPKGLGLKLLGVWLILTAALPYLPVFAGMGLLLRLLAFAAGLLILIGA
jgi:hypothetical protein